MKKHVLLMFTAIFFACGNLLVLTSCGDDKDDDFNYNNTPSTDNIAAKAEVSYYVDLGANTLELADVDVTYLDENGETVTMRMTDKQWVLKRTVLASQMPAEFSLKVSFNQKFDATIDPDKQYEFGCVSRIPFVVYNSKGQKIAEHPGAVAVSDGSHPSLKGSDMSSWWFSYALGINPDKLINFDKKSLTIKTDKAVFNKMDYEYPYLN